MSTPRLRCRAVRKLLPLHVGGDLEARQTAGLDEHLHECLPCFREFRELATLRGRLGVLAEEPLPVGALDHFVEDVMARIELGEAGPVAEAPRRRLFRPAWIPAAAAAAVLGAVVWGVQSSTPVAPPELPKVTTAEAPAAEIQQSRPMPRPFNTRGAVPVSTGFPLVADPWASRPNVTPPLSPDLESLLPLLPEALEGTIQGGTILPAGSLSDPSLLLPDPQRKPRLREP